MCSIVALLAKLRDGIFIHNHMAARKQTSSSSCNKNI